jgi:hypothetical protein
MRAAGLVMLDLKGNLVGQRVIVTKKEELDEEYLLLYMEDQVAQFALDYSKGNKLVATVLEGLSFGSKSAKSDLIAANWWGVVTTLRTLYPNLLIGKIPVTSWRSKIVTRDEQKEAKALHKTDPLKKVVVAKLPPDVLSTFEKYLSDNKLKKSCMYDLADAYFLGQVRLTLGDFE